MNFFRSILIVFICCILVCCKSRKPALTITETHSVEAADRQLTGMREMLPDNQVERTEEGISIILNSEILFASNSSILSDGARASVLQLAKALKEHGNSRNILINGHTDATGTAEYNQWLSERRASSVKAFLEAQGINGDFVTITGYGDKNPVAENSTAEGRSKNRRVEVILLEQ